MHNFVTTEIAEISCCVFFKGQIQFFNTPVFFAMCDKNRLTLAYVTTGSVSCMPAVIVVTVSTVVIPRATRAGAALASIQNDSQAMETSRTVGM